MRRPLHPVFPCATMEKTGKGTRDMKRILVGIAGGSGSGKTTLANRLKEEFGDDAVIISHDFYYRDNRNIPLEERKLQNYDHPDSLETELMVEDLKKLRDGQTIQCPIYSFVEYTRTEETLTVRPAKVIIVEGVLIFENQDLCNLLDIRAFIDADADVRVLRRMKRDIKKRGRSMDSVINQYLGTVKPMHEKFVEPSKKNADVIIPNGAHNLVAQQMLVDRIRAAISE